MILYGFVLNNDIQHGIVRLPTDLNFSIIHNSDVNDESTEN